MSKVQIIEYEKTDIDGFYHVIFKSKRYFEELKEQAERFEVLSEQHDEALMQNKRYREALEEIIHLEQLKETNVFGYDNEDITSYVETVARKALGESK